MSRKKHRSQRKVKAFNLLDWVNLFSDWLSSFLPKPEVLNTECSDDKDLLEPPSWAVIPAKLQEQIDQVLALEQEVEGLQEEEKKSPMPVGTINLDQLQALKTNFFENQRRKSILDKLTQRCDELIDVLDLNVKNNI